MTTSSPKQIYDSEDDLDEINENANDSSDDGIEWTNQLARELHKPVKKGFENAECSLQLLTGFGHVISLIFPHINDLIMDTNTYSVS